MVIVHGEAPPIGALLGGPSGIVVVPIPISGSTFWWAGVLAKRNEKVD